MTGGTVASAGGGILSLAAEAVSSELRTGQGHAAARWPPASLDSSCALRDRQLARNREESGQDLNVPVPSQSVRPPNWLYTLQRSRRISGIFSIRDPAAPKSPD